MYVQFSRVATLVLQALKSLLRWADPIGTRLVPSLAHPGGNLTGLSLAQTGDLAGKWLGLLKETSPRLSKVAVIANPDSLYVRKISSDLRNTAQARSLKPIFYPLLSFASVGGLMAYGQDHVLQMRLAAEYVDKILRGARPADLPIEQPTQVQLIVNLKTAKSLGITFPESILARADQVIQ